MKRSTGFYCHGWGSYVVCRAPMHCNQACGSYKAVAVTGVKVRRFVDADDKHGVLYLKTGYVNGGQLVIVDDSNK